MIIKRIWGESIDATTRKPWSENSDRNIGGGGVVRKRLASDWGSGGGGKVGKRNAIRMSKMAGNNHPGKRRGA